jgi:hypothetical protein
MKKSLILFFIAALFPVVCVAGALDDLEQNINKQEMTKQKESMRIADCKQAIEKAKKHRNEIGEPGTMRIFNAGHTTVNPEGEIISSELYRVMDFASNGVMVSNCGFVVGASCDNERVFVYTTDTNYANEDVFRGKGLLYKRDGNYRYTTVIGSQNSVPAYRATQYKASEIEYKTYLKDKTEECD